MTASTAKKIVLGNSIKLDYENDSSAATVYVTLGRGLVRRAVRLELATMVIQLMGGCKSNL